MDEDFRHTRLQKVAPLAVDRLGDNLDGRDVLPHDEKRNYGAVVRPGKDMLRTYASRVDKCQGLGQKSFML